MTRVKRFFEPDSLRPCDLNSYNPAFRPLTLFSSPEHAASSAKLPDRRPPYRPPAYRRVWEDVNTRQRAGAIIPPTPPGFLNEGNVWPLYSVSPSRNEPRIPRIPRTFSCTRWPSHLGRNRSTLPVRASLVVAATGRRCAGSTRLAGVYRSRDRAVNARRSLSCACMAAAAAWRRAWHRCAISSAVKIGPVSAA